MFPRALSRRSSRQPTGGDAGAQPRHRRSSVPDTPTASSPTRSARWVPTSAWAASWPYLRDPWDTIEGPNDITAYRESFLRRWFADDSYTPARRPSTSSSTPGTRSRSRLPCVPTPVLVRDYIWAPLGELPIEFIFPFGARWLDVLPLLPGVEIVDRIGDGGRPYATTSKPGA